VNKKGQLVQKLVSWLKDKENTSRLNNLLNKYTNKITHKEQTNWIVLNAKQKKWKYKILEWKKNYSSNMNSFSQQNSYNDFNQLLSNNKNYIKFINIYWIIEKNIFFNNIDILFNLCNINILSEKKILFKESYINEILKNKSCSSGLTYQLMMLQVLGKIVKKLKKE
jgi:hypothetical protein